MNLRPVARKKRAPSQIDEHTAAFLAATLAADKSAFGSVVEPYRAELQVHCYRMLGSFEDSADLVQETLFRAWRNRASFEGRSTPRTWLYRIATNACLDALDRRTRRVMPPDMLPPADPSVVLKPPTTDLPWVQPYPDRLLKLENGTPGDVEPGAAIVSKATIELGFIAAMQHLPPRQRAALILRDVLGWSANQSASLLELNIAALNSALQRARSTIRKHQPARRLDRTADADPGEHAGTLLKRYMDGIERADPEALTTLLREDARMVMPRQATWFDGRQAVVAAIALGLRSQVGGDVRMLPTGANLQPAAAGYFRQPGAVEHAAMVLDVLRIEGAEIVEITVFGAQIFKPFGLPQTL